jgi:hypothetical protein
MMVQTWNLSTWEDKAGGLWLEAILGFIARSCLKNNKTTIKKTLKSL